ncbi:MAG: NIF family HAD-type phosphatase [Candidatus Methanomethylicia archaeon]
MDFDGVVTNLNIDWNKVREDVSKRVGFKVNSMLDFWEKYFGTELFDLANEIVEKYELEGVMKASLHEDVKQLLILFKGKIYIASMQSKKVINMFLEKYSLEKFFKGVLGRDDFGSKIKQVQYILEKEKNVKRILLIDDSKRNISRCQKLGITCILFNRRAGDNLVHLVKNASYLRPEW